LIVYTRGNTDVCLALYDHNKTILAENDDAEGGSKNALVKSDVQAGIYYVKVFGFENETGRYDLYTAHRKPIPPDLYENDDSLEFAKTIQAGASQQRTFTSSGDEDWVRFTAEQGKYEIKAVGFDEKQDTQLEIFDEKGEEIASDDDGGEHYDAAITILLDAGIYYIRVTTLDSEPLALYNYTLSVRLVE
ncbi:MAG: peptidase, partial [Treponema sp.]|nr:peptidase [Treponema sp.]